MRIHLLITPLLLAGCSSHASKQDQLNAAANESTPAANVLAGADQNGMTEEALNEAGSAQAANAAATHDHKEARPNSAESPSPPQPVEPAQDEAGNSNSD
jgi:outer membrane murein-binding lipoprotein Lpp